MDIERIRQIYNKIKESNTYLEDSTLKALTAIALHRVEDKWGIPFDQESINVLLSFVDITPFHTITRTMHNIKSHEDLETVYKKYQKEPEYMTAVFHISKIIEEYANPVKRACKELGITQKELAERIGVSADTISNWAKGKTKTPKWALELFRLMKLESKLKDQDKKLDEIIRIAKSLKSE